MKIKQKSRIVPLFTVALTGMLLFLLGSILFGVVGTSATVSAAPEKKCFYQGPLIDDEVGTTDFVCNEEILRQYKDIVGGNFRRFDPNKCYIIREIPGDPKVAEEINCAEARRLVDETNDVPVDEPEDSNPAGDTGSCAGVDTSIVNCEANNDSGEIQDNGIWALLLIVLNILTAGVGIFAVGGIVYGSVLYTTAEDKPDQVKKATDIITNVVIGLVAFALMWALLNFLVPGGIFA